MKCRRFCQLFSFCLLWLVFLPSFGQDALTLEDRFKVEVTWQSPGMTQPQVAEGGLLTNRFGYFHFSDPNLVEVLVKVLDGCSVNNNHWVFAAGLTDVPVVMTVTDTESGIIKTYSSPNNLAPFNTIGDTQAFATCPEPLIQTYKDVSPEPREKTIRLLNDRFQVSLEVTDFEGQTSAAEAQFLRNATAGFFLTEGAAEADAFVKIVDGTATNGSFWVYLTSFSQMGLTYTVTDTETGVTKTYTQESGSFLSYIDRQFGKADDHRWIFPWVSNNANFRSRIIVNNFSPNAITVTMVAIRSDGTNQTAERTIAGGGFLNERASSLFGGLGEGPGYAVTMTAKEPSLSGRWVTDNLGTGSGGSPSQGVAIKFDGGDEVDDPRNARLGNALMFGYLPNDGNTLAAPVIVNTGNRNANVTLYFFSSAGNLLGTETVENLVPGFPFAAVLSDLLPGVEGDVSMVAHTRDQPLTGVVFTFNGQLEPSLGNAEAIAFVPPGSKRSD